ncbi:uncharacterized protein LOC110975864 isoform X2 [Acanthaster planci]|nr:uncharacterized protein LOC110975864 isoform X2 [Acanthaster planci]XP_022084404.1 uncharacterized protein LOC110975864 isoform X2 [Acanthaster planci]XP_022084405.1 uncharacterized protein LOC110975864 isoform X2 [Acanthaster planci]XP_022084406.1 uncharacterized protein LOC110975864 isoform X2 [Acanthaster planci]XP_022084407.1 uncharacterized protein LOC110975864 isoform X2 [Acanthaster planci]
MSDPTRDVNMNVKTIRDLSKKADGTKAVAEFYDKWAEKYDEDLEKGNYEGPALCVDALFKVLPDKSALIVDCAAGTGKVGEGLAKLGFKRIDAVDISQKSLDISASKRVYERLICDSLGKHKLKGVDDGYYSGLICVGGVAAGHISHDAFSEWTRIVKKGKTYSPILGKMSDPTKDLEENIKMIRQMSKKPDGIKAVAEFYDKWAEDYDEDLEKEHYKGPALCVDALSKAMPDKSALIVDCAAGTGKAGEELAKRGYKRIDAVDISPKSLDISASKGVYERLICDSLGKHKLKGVGDGFYSGLICVGGVSAGHISQDAFPEWTRIVKKGGFMVFAVSKAVVSGDQQNEAFIETEDAISDLVQKGVWELVEKTNIPYVKSHEADLYTIRRL